MSTDSSIFAGFEAALQEARRFVGATAPNPPVGAAMLAVDGRVLAVAAHQKAGTEHAEARLIRELTESGDIEEAHTLIVTLEPCNHQGRTPPCTRAILAKPQIRVVWIGVNDPNPKVVGGGQAALEGGGLVVHALPKGSPMASHCARLIAPFQRWSATGKPFVVIKSAHWFHSRSARESAWQAFGLFLNDAAQFRCSMIPPAGSKTFTSDDSLREAHQLRKESDALLTGSGTVLADNPSFTVRRVVDHPERKRLLVLLDRRRRVPEAWCDEAAARGFSVNRVIKRMSWDELMLELGAQGILQVLIEAGPELTASILNDQHYDEHIAFLSAPGVGDLKLIRHNWRS